MILPLQCTPGQVARRLMASWRGLATMGFGLALLWTQAARAAENDVEQDPAVRPTAVSSATRARELAAQVKEIAGSSTISRVRKEKRIATAVRVAVVAATAYQHDPDKMLGITIQLTAAAGRAAPSYAEVIANAAAFAPRVGSIEGATGLIRAAASGRTPNSRTTRTAQIESEETPLPAPEPVQHKKKTKHTAQVAPPPAAEEPMEENAAVPESEAAQRTSTHEVADAPDETEHHPRPAGTVHDPAARISLGENSSMQFTADLGVRHDSNVFLSDTNVVGDTILSATPGVNFQYGREAETHALLSYAEALNHYINHSAPGISLGSGAGNFGYDDGVVAVALSGTYQEYFQANPDVVVAGSNQLVHSDNFSLSANVETQLGARTSVKVGSDFSDTNFKTTGFVGNQNLQFPVSFYYGITPKVDLSAGYTFATDRPSGDGPRGRNNYYNVGGRGHFTPKLSGSINAGYQTRSVGDNPKEHTFAFNGSFDYEVTAKTRATLGLSRNFGVSSLGQSTKNAAYNLGLSTDLTPQWQLGAGLSYQDNNYGATVFTTDLAPSPPRVDHFWQGSLQASYLFTQWLSTNASYVFRRNQSNLAGVEYSDGILSLSLGLKY